MSNEDIKVVSKKKPEVNDSSKELISNSETPVDIYSGIKKKKTIIKSLRDLVNGQEDKSTFKNVKKLQTEWKNIGQLDNPKDKTLWTTYNALLDRFYDNRSIYFELKELDRKKNLELNRIENVEILNEDCRNINHKADVIHLGYISKTLKFLDHAQQNLNEKGIAIFHEAYNNSWLGFKRRADWGTIPSNFSELMEKHGFLTKKFERVKFYGPSKSHIIAYLQKI